MTILECGINFGQKNLLITKFSNKKDEQEIDNNLRAGFISAIGQFSNEIYKSAPNLVKMSDFKMVLKTKTIKSFEENSIEQPIICYSIIDGSEEEIVKPLLEEVLNQFLNRYSVFDITTKKDEYFDEFKPRVKEILGDLIIDVETRVKGLFS